jgi:hypothetical protein
MVNAGAEIPRRLLVSGHPSIREATSGALWRTDPTARASRNGKIQTMSHIARFKKLLTAGAALGALALTTTSASADFFRLNYATSSQSGIILFHTPTGLQTGLISLVSGTETTTGSNFPDSGVAQTVSGPDPIGTFSNLNGLKNNNQLIAFPPTVPGGHTSVSATSWFDTHGLSFKAADGTEIALFNFAGNFVVESNNGANTILSFGAGSATLTDLSAPAPTPGAGLASLLALVGLAAARRAKLC